jgi:hypothetical protein
MDIYDTTTALGAVYIHVYESVYYYPYDYMHDLQTSQIGIKFII